MQTKRKYDLRNSTDASGDAIQARINRAVAEYPTGMIRYFRRPPSRTSDRIVGIVG